MHRRGMKGGERGLERAINAMFTCRPPPQFKEKGAVTISLRPADGGEGGERGDEGGGLPAAMHIDGSRTVRKLAFIGGMHVVKAE